MPTAMVAQILVPTLGESVTEATVARWLKQPGEAVARDEPVVELETDKVTLEVPAPQAGILGEVLATEGSNVPVGAVLGTIADGAAMTTAAASAHPNPPPQAGEGSARSARVGGAADESPAAMLERSGPAVRKLVAESGVDASGLVPTG